MREWVADGAVRVENAIHPVGTLRLTARELEEYRVGRTFAAGEAARLASETLPSLRDRVPLEIAPTEHDRRYLQTKKEKLGHILNLMS